MSVVSINVIAVVIPRFDAATMSSSNAVNFPIRDKKVTVHLLRHCESLFNTGDDTASTDVPLSAKGEHQASKLTGEFDLVIVSPLRRAEQTLELSKIRWHQLCSQCYLVREHVVDLCDVLSHERPSISTSSTSASSSQYFNADGTLRKESDAELAARVVAFKRFLSFVLAACPSVRSVLIVSHADFLWRLTARKIKGDDDEDELFGQWLDNGELYKWK